MSLFDDVTNQLTDAAVTALIREGEMEPAQGAGAVVSPPTYAQPQGVTTKAPAYALSEHALIPARAVSGWHHEHAMLGDQPRLGNRVVLNAVGACADNAESPLWTHQDQLGLTLPGFVLSGHQITTEQIEASIKRTKKTTPTPTARAQITEAIKIAKSSWVLAHRYADSWLMYAQGESRQIWDEGGDLKDILLSISHDRGDLVYRYATNAAIYGNWLSSGTAKRNAIPRAYSCEITGYGAHSVKRGATKLDPTGGTSNSGLQVTQDGDGIAVRQKGKKPSEAGFGQVPNQPEGRGFTCELILRQASVSLRALERFRYPDDTDGQQALAARRVYVLLAMAGHLLAGQDGFLRSGCDLVTVEERWGWRRHGRRTPVEIEVPSLDEVSEALHVAVTAAAGQGLRFAEPITVAPSEAQLDLIVDRVLVESAKGATEVPE
jgi:CRISPR-associated protein Csb1